MNKKIVKSTPFGDVGIIWAATARRPLITRVLLSTPLVSAERLVCELYPNARAVSCVEIDAVASEFRRMLQGASVAFDLASVDLSLCGEFQQRVLRAEHGIPRGSVSTYRLLKGNRSR